MSGIGTAVKDLTPVVSAQPVYQVDMTTGLPAGPSGGATAIAGSNGTAPASSANPVPTATAPNSLAGSAPSSAQTTAVASSLTAKTSAGNCYGFNVLSGASAGYFMLFNSTSAPADGAVTPFKVYKMAADTSLGIHWDVPRRFSTGITGVFSTTGPFTKTASATAFIGIDYV